MTKLILICGPSGVGKTTYSLSLTKEIEAVRFSIDPWMQTLFSEDIRQQRIEKRNNEKDPSVCSFDVTETMFNFMEPKFEVPDQKELKGGLEVNTFQKSERSEHPRP